MKRKRKKERRKLHGEVQACELLCPQKSPEPEIDVIIRRFDRSVSRGKCPTRLRSVAFAAWIRMADSLGGSSRSFARKLLLLVRDLCHADGQTAFAKISGRAPTGPSESNSEAIP